MALSGQELHEIEDELKNLPTRRSGCIDALRIVQKHRGWVSDEAINDLADVLGMSRAEIDSVATFYNLIFRQPVGKHVIMVCDSVSCWVMGEERLIDHLQRKLGIKPGETTPDGLFTLLPTVCLGHCEQAPVMMLDGEIVGNLTEEKIDEILAKR
ncbi:MAG: NADH-quinone oxidoreductase subunit NuoE [Armatimonadota bacterium]